MTLDEFRARLADAPDALALRDLTAHEDDLLPCPCFTINRVDGFYAYGHCWRSSFTSKAGATCRCQYVGVHVWGDREAGKTLARLLTAMDWYGKWPLVYHGASIPWVPA